MQVLIKKLFYGEMKSRSRSHLFSTTRPWWFADKKNKDHNEAHTFLDFLVSLYL